MKKRRNAILREDSILLKRWTLDGPQGQDDIGFTRSGCRDL